MTAFHAIELAAATKETTVLVSGGAGSVSQYVIEFAKARGAKVITTSPRRRRPRSRGTAAPITRSTTNEKMSANGSRS